MGTDEHLELVMMWSTHKASPRSLFVTTGSVVAALVITGTWFAFAGSAPAATAAVTQSNPIKAAIEARERSADAALASLNADPAALQGLLAQKAASQSENQLQSNGPAGLTSTTPTDDGITTTADAPAPTVEIQANSRWIGQVNGTTYRIWAGFSGSDPTDGRLLIVSDGASNDSVVDLPTFGRLTISAEHSGDLTVIANDGSSHIFAVGSMSWVN